MLLNALPESVPASNAAHGLEGFIGIFLALKPPESSVVDARIVYEVARLMDIGELPPKRLDRVEVRLAALVVSRRRNGHGEGPLACS